MIYKTTNGNQRVRRGFDALLHGRIFIKIWTDSARLSPRSQVAHWRQVRWENFDHNFRFYQLTSDHTQLCIFLSFVYCGNSCLWVVIILVFSVAKHGTTWCFQTLRLSHFYILFIYSLLQIYNISEDKRYCKTDYEVQWRRTYN